MIFHRCKTVWFVIAISACVAASSAWAQNAKAKKTKPDENPAEEVASPEDTDPGVNAILATKPHTPAQCARAAKILCDLNRPELAKPFLKKVIDAKLDADQLADLGQELGSAIFLNLATRESLQPEGKELADAVSAAVTARLEDSKRIAELIGQLQDESPDKRYRATVSLQEVARAAAGMMVEVLADPSRSREHANIRSAFLGMGRLGREVLTGVLEDADADLAIQVISILAEMKNSTVSLALLRPCYSEQSDPKVRQAAAVALKQQGGAISQADAIRLLTNAAKSYFERQQPVEGELEGKVEIWQWNAAERKCVARSCSVNAARRIFAARWARDAYRIAPNERPLQVLYLTTKLNAEQYDLGLDQALESNSGTVAEAKKFGVPILCDVLSLAMADGPIATGHVGAAIAAARLLGDDGNTESVLNQGAAASPLALAVRSSDRRVRMAALHAIAQLKPAKIYPGSSAVPAALSFFISTSGRRHALTAAPSYQQGRNVAGMLVSQGLESDAVVTGRELLQMAASSPDYELAMIDVSITKPDIGTLLQQLRHDERTAGLRVGLLARDGFLSQAEHAASTDSLSKAFSWPTDEKASAWQVEQLATLEPEEFVDYDLRQQQAVESLALLDAFLHDSAKIYDLRRTEEAVLSALHVSKLSKKAIEIMALMNSAECQQALVETASQLTLPLPLRSAAGTAFRQSVEKHGILLTSDAIQQQYRRYNESEKQDSGTQRVLGLILDCLETPTKDKNAVQAPKR